MEFKIYLTMAIISMFVMMLLFLWSVIVLVQRNKRHKALVKSLKDYLQQHPSEYKLIDEYDAITSRMSDILIEIKGTEDIPYLKTISIIEMFRETKRN